VTSLGSVGTAPPGAIFFDSDSALSDAAAAAFAARQFAGPARYLSLQDGQKPGDLSAAEAGIIHRAGMAIVPVQHVMRPGWNPTPALGTLYGTRAAANAASIGVPPGVTIWLDMEGCDIPGDGMFVRYCNSWASPVRALGYEPGIYVGYGCGMSSFDLYYHLTFKRYWRSGSHSVPNVDVRGYTIQQTIGGETLAGVEFDRDVVSADAMGETFTWWTI
jgi:Domain of unknown function (DUF1906)